MLEIVVFSLWLSLIVHTTSVENKFSPTTSAVSCNSSPAFTTTFSFGVILTSVTFGLTTLYLIVAVVPSPTHVSTGVPFPDCATTLTLAVLSPSVKVFSVTYVPSDSILPSSLVIPKLVLSVSIANNCVNIFGISMFTVYGNSFILIGSLTSIFKFWLFKLIFNVYSFAKKLAYLPPVMISKYS